MVFYIAQCASQNRASPRDDEVISVTHTAHGLNDFTLIILDDFNSFELLSKSQASQEETTRGKQGRPLTMPSEKQKFAT